jgi:hypothetical protein
MACAGKPECALHRCSTPARPAGTAAIAVLAPLRLCGDRSAGERSQHAGPRAAASDAVPPSADTKIPGQPSTPP